jgi:hypothetical protein
VFKLEYEIKICVVCGKPYERAVRKTKTRSIKNGARSVNCKTCSRKCSKSWIRLGQKDYKNKHKQMIKLKRKQRELRV